MEKYILIVIFLVVVTTLLFFYFGSRSYKIIRGGKALSWTLEKQETFSNVVRWIFKGLAILVIVTTLIPMLMDIPAMINGKYEVVEGIPSVTHRSPSVIGFRQDIIINGVEISLYLQSPIFDNKKYRVLYLPKSHYGIKAEIIE